jgi:predicted membrane protein
MEDLGKQKEVREQQDKDWKDMERRDRRGKITGGLLVVAIGSLFLARELGVEIPFWVLSWKMLLIGIGLVTAVKHKFLNPGWLLLVGVGGVFLLTDIYPDTQIKPLLWPILLIFVGLLIMFKPRRKRAEHCRHQWRKQNRHYRRYHQRYGHDHFGQQTHAQDYEHSYPMREEPTTEDFIDSVVFMAGVKKNILSKNFKGGDITNIFGGSEINLTQADFAGTANLEITQVFGGCKIIVPSNWEIRSELVTVLGNVEDRRVPQPNLEKDTTKVLVLTGTTVFGGIDIRSF